MEVFEIFNILDSLLDDNSEGFDIAIIFINLYVAKRIGVVKEVIISRSFSIILSFISNVNCTIDSSVLFKVNGKHPY